VIGEESGANFFQPITTENKSKTNVFANNFRHSKDIALHRGELRVLIEVVFTEKRKKFSDFHGFTGKECHSPGVGWDASSLTCFQRLIIVKVLRPECLVESVRLFVVERMGWKFVKNVGFDLQEMFEESTNRKPLIFILSPGNCLLWLLFLL